MRGRFEWLGAGVILLAVGTGATREMGGDIDAFEERLVGMLTQSERGEPAGLHFRTE